MNNVDKLAQMGTSTWLDDLSRQRLQSGNLRELIDTKSVVGVTTNPTIFAKAMSQGTAYDADIAKLKEQGAAVDEAVYSLAIDDVRAACDELHDVFVDSNGEDGRVSIEVDPRISDDAEATLNQARDLWKKVDRPNAMIKIPATDGSLQAIEDALAEGICVNVTLIFSLKRYVKVVDRYKEGIRRAEAAGLDVTKIFSVASIFISRIDTEVDKRLEEIGTPEALKLRGQVGLAEAKLCYGFFESAFLHPERLPAPDPLPAGANFQRPLWASTGVKNPEYPATLYVTELAGPETVNTMPEATLDAFLDADVRLGDALTGMLETANSTCGRAAQLVSLEEVYEQLEQEGVDKFVASWNELLETMSAKL
ncbi:transaldolase [Corynebacterium sp. LK2537]|uniref:transaldolase n=1 Tax=Corynebacterium sp. LK2537 TaxID=3110471 RepID=UPI0034CEE406